MDLFLYLTLSLPNMAKGKIQQKFPISFLDHVIVQVERFHMNCHITGFPPQSQMLEPPYKTPLFTLAVTAWQ